MTRDDVIWEAVRRLRAERAEKCLTYLAETIEEWERYYANRHPSDDWEKAMGHACFMVDTWMEFYADAIRPVGPAHS